MDIVKIEITLPLPSEVAVDTTYKIEGTAKVADILSPPPWLYAQVQKKDWYKPDIIEETIYERGFPMPVTGTFSIDWRPKKKGIYEVTIVATPAPLALPLIGVPPITGESEMMKVNVGEEQVGEFTELKITKYEKITV